MLFRSALAAILLCAVNVVAHAQSAAGYAGGSMISQVTPNCVVYSTAGGTSDALTVPLLTNPALPCLPKQTLLSLTLTATNTTTTPTLASYGYAAETIVQASGSAVTVGQLVSGSVVLLMNDGTHWRLVAGGGGGGGGTTSITATAPIVVTPSPITGTGVVSVNHATSSTVGVVEPDDTSLVVDGSGILSVEPCGSTTLARTDCIETFTAAQTFGENYGSQSVQSGTTYNMAESDCGTSIKFTSASAVTLTTLATATVPCVVEIEQAGAGQVTVSPGSGASQDSAHSYSKTYGQWAIIWIKVDANVGGSAAHYVISGDGA